MVVKDKGIKNIIFDLGGVVLDIDINRSVEAFKNIGVNNIAPSHIHPETRGLFWQLETGEISAREFFKHVLEEYPTSSPVSQKELFEAWSALLLPFSKERVELIQSLREQGYNLFLLSNTNFPHRVRFLNNFNRQFGFDMESLFDKCYYSDVLGTRKPNADIYHTVLNDADLDPKQTVFIDDNEQNITAAQQCGLYGYHLRADKGETILDIF